MHLERVREVTRDIDKGSAHDLANALNEYTDLAARRQRTAVSLKHGKGKVEKARLDYEALRKLVNIGLSEQLTNAGYRRMK